MKTNRKHGFTIVELVVVIAIIAVLAAVLIPTFASIIKKANDSAYLQERTNQKIEDLAEKVEKLNYFTWEDFEKKLADELAKVGDTDTAEIKKAVEAAMKEYATYSQASMTGLTADQVKKIVDEAMAGQLTTAQVEAIVKAAVGDKPVDVDAIVNAVVAKMPKATGITKAEMQSAIKQALAGLNISSIEEEDIAKALAAFGVSTLTKEDINGIISSATSDNTTLAKALNIRLANLGVGKQKTVYDMVVKIGGENVITGTNTTSTVSDGSSTLLYDLDDNKFLTVKDGVVDYDGGLSLSGELNEAYKYWIFANSVDTTYSTYLLRGSEVTSAVVTKGIDVGYKTDVTSITYDRSTATSAQTVVIRTNSASTELVVNAQYDTVKHYDAVGQVHVIAVDKNNCYEENGKAAFTQVDSGKYKTTSTADVELLFVSDVAKVKVELAAGTVEHAHAISEAEANTINGTNPGVVFDYDGNGAQSELDVYHHVNDEDKIGLTTDYTANKANEAVIEVVNEAVENTVFAGVSVSKTGEATKLMTLTEFAAAVNEGNSYEGYTIKLLDNIDLSNIEWTPINGFAGTFDGNYKTLSGLKLNVVTGTGSSDEKHIGFFEKTENATIKNLTISGFEVYGTGRIASGALIGNASNGLTLSNIILTSSNKLTGKWSGGFIGKTTVTKDNSELRDCKYIIDNCHSSVEIEGERTGGFIGQMDGSNNSIYKSSNGFAIFTSCSFNGKLNANTETAMAGGFIAQTTNSDRTWFVYTYQNCSVNNGNIVSSGSKGDFTAVSQSAYSLFGCKINDEAVTLPTDINFAFCNSATVYIYSINGTIYAIKAANGGYYNIESDTIGVDAQVAGSSNHSISLSDTTDWHKVTNAYTDFYGNYIVSADASAIYRSVPTNLEEGTKLQRRTYVAGHNYSANQDTYGFDMWRIVDNSVTAEGTGFGQWQDVETDGFTGFVLGAGIYYYSDPTPFVDSELYEVSSRETSDHWMIYTVTAK